MKALKRIITAVCVALLTAVQTALPVYSADGDIPPVLESLLPQALDGLAFGQNDWLAYCRIRLCGREDTEDFAASVKGSAEELMGSSGFVRPTELQRAAIVLSSVGECPDKLMDAAVYKNEDLNRQGFNAYIWALIAANCCTAPEPDGAVNTKTSLAEHILSKQLPDGGFTLKGTAADTDITAAVIYALAPLKDDAAVTAALERAEQCLTSLQLENGGYMTIGIENCESAAQAVIAFTALGYDGSDSRVASAYNAMMEYSREGGFAHLPEGDISGVATVQAAQALTALELAERGESLYSVPAKTEGQQKLPDSTPAESGSAVESDKDEEQSFAVTGGQIKLVIVASLFGIAAVTIAVFFVTKRRKTALLWAGVICVAAGAAVCFTDIRTQEEYYADRPEDSGITVAVSVDCGTALTNMERIDPSVNPPEVIPDDGIVIYQTMVTIPEGGTAFDALIAAARQDRVQVDYTGTSYGVYISGIGYIYEFGFGPMSGWLYRVNGGEPSMSAGAYTLSEGDIVEFIYTCEMGDVQGINGE